MNSVYRISQVSEEGVNKPRAEHVCIEPEENSPASYTFPFLNCTSILRLHIPMTILVYQDQYSPLQPILPLVFGPVSNLGGNGIGVGI
jgi:hypothetical protein